VEGSFSIERRGDCLRVSGELDDQCAAAAAETVRRLAGTDPTAPFDLDLTDVTFIDSVGLRELLRLRQGVPSLRIVAVNSRIQRVFEITGTAELLLDWSIPIRSEPSPREPRS
jgi:anti-anti-sigma factor